LMPQPDSHRPSDRLFIIGLSVIGAVYLLLIVAMIAADAAYTTPAVIAKALAAPQIRYAIKLSLISCTITAILSVWVAVPLGYLLSRVKFPGRGLVDVVLDIPIVLPPLVVGLSLLILFQVRIGGKSIERHFQETLHLKVTYAVPSVVLAQFAVACAFAVRTMRVTFDQINPPGQDRSGNSDRS
jgi:molybdate transport system permease protein